MEFTVYLISSHGFLLREDAEGYASGLEGFVEFGGEALAVDGELGLLAFDFNEVKGAVVCLAERLDGGPVEES